MHPSQEIGGTLSDKLFGQRIVLAVTGSIAAVETVRLARSLIRHGAEIHPVMSKAATRIIHPDALEFATGRIPMTELTGAVEHVTLCGDTMDKVDMLLIAPATANTISKIANGIDDTPVTTFATTALGSEIPMAVVPAMHGSMYNHGILADNLRTLERVGITMIGPRMEEDVAKMATRTEIVDEVLRILGPHDLDGKEVLIVTGGTMEPLDDMRVLATRSSGATGLALAREAYHRGADVVLWHNTTIEPPSFVASSQPFRTVADLLALVKKLRRTDIALVPAAISDFTPKDGKYDGKLESGKGMTLELEPTPKIIHGLTSKAEVLVGFKAGSGISREELLGQARDRMKRSRAALFVANDLSRVEHRTTEVTILDPDGGSEDARGRKEDVARVIMDKVVDRT